LPVGSSVVGGDGVLHFVDADAAAGERVRDPAECGTAYFCAPKTCTCETPLTVEMRCAITVSAYSSTV
jgi:hypothetical protein